MLFLAYNRNILKNISSQKISLGFLPGKVVECLAAKGIEELNYQTEVKIVASQYGHILKHLNETPLQELIKIMRCFNTAKYVGISRGKRDGTKIRFLSDDKNGTAELLVTVYNKKKDILLAKTAFRPQKKITEIIDEWRKRGIDVGEVAKSSGVVEENNGTGAKPPFIGPTSTISVAQFEKKSNKSSQKDKIQFSVDADTVYDDGVS